MRKSLRRLFGIWRRTRLPYKLILIYMPLILLPALAGINVLTESYTTYSKAKTAEYTTDLLSLMGQKIDERIRSYEQFSKQIMTDPDLLKLFAAKPRTSFEKFKLEGEINEKLNVFWLGADQNSYIRAIKVETPDAIYTYGVDARADFNVRNDIYRAQVKEMKGGARWFTPETYDDAYSKFEAFRLARTIRDQKLNELGVISIIIRAEAFTDIFSQTKLQQGASLRLLTRDGTVMLDNGVHIDESESEVLTYAEDKIRNGWKITAQIPLNQLYEPIQGKVRLALFIVLGCIVLGLVLTHLLALDLVIPIRRLMQNMKMGVKGVRPGKLKHFNGAIEIVEMNDTFISIMYEIEQLIDEVAKQEVKKKNAEIRVLQNQLSPHFLYNTLNSIRWMAMIQKQDNIKEMVDALNQLLTYALRGTGEPVPLSLEMDMLHNYVNIQKVRFQHFDFVVEVPESVKDAKVLKFLLQPLIENALIHGLAQSDRPGRIRCAVETAGSHLIIEIIDNGVGMAPDKLSEVTSGLAGVSGQHYGIHSVQERIQLHYGTSYGLTIRSEPGVGTTIRVSIPLIDQLQGGDETHA